MKASLERIPPEQGESFIVRQFDEFRFSSRWHYHPEYEIMLVKEGKGNRFIGDTITAFTAGDLILLGPNIPHCYRSTEESSEKVTTQRNSCILLHFTEASIGNDLLNLPEARPICHLLQRCHQGLIVKGNTAKMISWLAEDLITLKGFQRWQSFLEILSQLADSTETEQITTTIQVAYNEKESARLGDLFEWISLNYSSPMRLSDAARVASMSENAFSRYFAQRTGKTFSSYIQELRLQKAARLLIEKKISVTEICYECGYNNISNFNRQFLNYYHMSPALYRKNFLLIE